ncbi:tetratricopeptide repeat protein [Candidatus Oleimmundimicrobium sp.]|uniref:tetratricopeptide repeat protein n=1 Tax=Candidatus Oleimmundimicrobium sp. TaxID=3060597 RepID=UPI00271C502F|nr:tetratricopeptide repeat protein [Candidatus Oleimmundimicrobium sp.]MDO8885931.1 tetratricopeptide repeat protein [Candidatus Oleimmundimicrobium sp.]
MVNLKKNIEEKQNNDSSKWLFWSIIVLTALTLVFACFVVKLAFFKKEVPRTYVERNLLMYKSQIENDPTDAVAYVNLGQTYFEIDQEDKAIKEFEKAISLDSKYAEPHYFLAVIYERKGETSKSIKELKKTVELSPSHDFAYFLLGKIYLEQNNPKEAINVLEKCVELNPVSANAHYSLGLAYEKVGKKDLAIREYEEALKYVPDYDDAKKAIERLTAS